ncbi:MAG: DNA methyltransferase [Candidatus Pacearchaeota archaeon]|nr:DNA methyltransferase [Candidatus Pacearchaeota archaeon]
MESNALVTYDKKDILIELNLIKYKLNNQGINYEVETKSKEWKDLPKNMNHKLHTICSYMAMFPPSIPNHFIGKYSKEGDIVLDTFSGRGTTVLESCLMNRIGIGNDLNPLAFLLTKAKSNVPQKSRIITRINQLEEEYNKIKKISIKNEEEKVKMIFNNYTLRQLIFLKEKLNWNKNNIDAFITALLVGILHGNSEGYLSLKMPNTFSMAPNYVKNYISQHGLIKPKRDAFDLLRKKIEKCYQRPLQQGKSYR